MVRINLLQEKKISPKTAGAVQQLIVGAFLLVAALVLMFAWNWRISTQISEVDTDIAQVNKKIKELEAIIGDIDKIKKTRDELTKKINIIKDLNANRTGPVRALQDLSFAIPYNPDEKLKKKMWINSLKESAGGKFSMEGMSRDTETIAEFITNLNSYDTYCEVAFKDSRRLKVNKTKFYKFNVKGEFCSPKPSKTDKP